MYTFIIKGRVKPCVRMTQRSKYSDPQAREYLASQEAIGLQLRQQMIENDWEMLPARTPLSVTLMFTFPGGWHNADIDNLAKSAIDSANKIVWPDDRWIDSLYATRTAGMDYKCVMKAQVIP